MTVMGPLPAGWLLRALANEHRKETIVDGIKALVVEYYENYTDADHLEYDFLHALEVVVHEAGDVVDLEEIIAEAEADLRGEGRQVRTLDTES